MRPLRIRWLGAERRERLLVALQAQVRLWLEEWSVVPDIFSVDLLESDNVWEVVSWYWSMAANSAATLHLGGPQASVAALGGLLAQAGVGDSLGIGRRVGERALQSLAAHLMNDAAMKLQPGTAPSAREREKRFGGQGAHLKGPGFHLVLWLDSGLCDQLSPLPQQERGELHERGSVIGSEPVPLDVLIDFGPATVGDTRGLRVDDVLVSRTPLQAPFQLAAPGGKAIANVRLHRAGELRAVSIDA